jgi:hypothetical protein
MNMRQLATAITKAEGKKLSVNVAQVSEILGLVADYFWADTALMVKLFVDAGVRRASARLSPKKRRAK